MLKTFINNGCQVWSSPCLLALNLDILTGLSIEAEPDVWSLVNLAVFSTTEPENACVKYFKKINISVHQK